MAVPATPAINEYTITASATRYDFSFFALIETQIAVRITDPTTYNQVDLVFGVDYIVTRSEAGTGYIVLTDSGKAKSPAGWSLTIYRDPEFSQPTDLIEGENFYAETVEATFDNLEYQIQYLLAIVERALYRPFGIPESQQITWLDLLNAIEATEKALALAEEAIRIASVAEAKANEALIAATTEATNITLGVVRLANIEEAEAGETNKVLVTEHYKRLKEYIEVRTQRATSEIVGVTQLATFNQTANGTRDDIAVTPLSLRGYVPPVQSPVSWGYTDDGYIFSKTDWQEEEASIDIWGRLNFSDGEVKRIMFPSILRLNREAVAGSVEKGSKGASLCVSTLTAEYVDLMISDNAEDPVAGVASFMFKGQIDTDAIPKPPQDLDSYAEGTTVVLSWRLPDDV